MANRTAVPLVIFSKPLPPPHTTLPAAIPSRWTACPPPSPCTRGRHSAGRHARPPALHARPPRLHLSADITLPCAHSRTGTPFMPSPNLLKLLGVGDDHQRCRKGRSRYSLVRPPWLRPWLRLPKHGHPVPGWCQTVINYHQLYH
jgi:hypothetical protein